VDEPGHIDGRPGAGATDNSVNLATECARSVRIRNTPLGPLLPCDAGGQSRTTPGTDEYLQVGPQNEPTTNAMQTEANQRTRARPRPDQQILRGTKILLRARRRHARIGNRREPLHRRRRRRLNRGTASDPDNEREHKNKTETADNRTG
jgi:hypothetical protein